MRTAGNQWCGVMLVLTLLSVLVFTLGEVPAHAAQDRITNMSVTYDIRRDGSVDVRQELHWQFGSSGRRGIDLSIATREQWESDRTQDVLYDVSNVQVTSPSGAPDSFRSSTTESGSTGSLDLRIGDPDRVVDGNKATYVISYQLRGALRTFDGIPEFYWDVNGPKYPNIDQFTIRITSPEPVQRGRCLIGRDVECDARITADGVAELTGGDVAAGEGLSVVAALVPGSVEGAEPNLEERRLEWPLLTGITSDVVVDADGIAHVEQELAYLLPFDAAKHAPTLVWRLPVRRPFSRSQDRVFHIDNFTVEGATRVKAYPPTGLEETEESQDIAWHVVPRVQGDTAHLTLSYDVEGAVATDADTAHFEWPLIPENVSEDVETTFTWTFPGNVQHAECVKVIGRKRADCFDVLDLVASGPTLSWQAESWKGYLLSDAWVGTDLPSSAVSDAAALLVPGIRAAARRELMYGIGGALAAVAGATGLIMGLSRVRTRHDRRWAEVPPGLTDRDGAPVRAARRSDVVPVRFDEPDCELTLAGLVLDGRHSPRHTVALLVHMAVNGAVTLRSKPLTVVKLTDAPLEQHVEKQLFKAATLREEPLDREQLRQMGSTVDSRQKALLANSDIFVPLRSEKPPVPLRNPVVWGLIALALAFPLAWLVVPGWLGPWGFLVVAGAVLGALAGVYLSLRTVPRRTLQPGGTALRDQVQGFRHYIATVEAHQLDFEADRDIYRRYLPWAVLFGLTKRWTQVCEELVADGKLPAPDTSFWIGAPSLHTIAGSLPSFHGPLGAAAPSPSPLRTSASSSEYPSSSSSSSSGGFFSGGGSGGSSGFSGGASGGGGGGGTNASSW